MRQFFFILFLGWSIIHIQAQQIETKLEAPKLQEFQNQLQSLKKQKLALNLHQLKLQDALASLQDQLAHLSDSTLHQQVRDKMADLGQEASFFQKKETKLLQRITKLQERITKLQKAHTKGKTVADLLENGGNKKFDFKNLGMLGGSFGASWGGFQNPKEYYLNISPQVGYKIAQKQSVGLGVTFISEQRKLQHQQLTGSETPLVASAPNYASNTLYGVKAFTRFVLGKSFFVEGQGEALNGKNQNHQRQWKPALWAGTGYQLAVGKQWGLNLVLRYNLLHDENSFYRSAMDFQVGIQLPGSTRIKAQKKAKQNAY